MPVLFPGCELSAREQQIVALLLDACDNDEIAKELGMARRTVKAHFNRLYLRYGINDGIKRVRLAVLMYRRQQQALALAKAKVDSTEPINPS